MTLSSISTNIAAYYAQQNISKASTDASLSVSRLSSGQRIVNASDDVASLAAGTALQSQVATLRTALQNASQGTSLLQVADGSLAQIQNILQRQKAIAVQASSGSVDDVQRSFLDQEFQALSSEIDRLSSSTNFNGVNLLDGSVFQANQVKTNAGASAAGSASFALAAGASSTSFASNDKISFNLGGNSLSFSFTTTASSGTLVQEGASGNASIDNLVSALKSYTGSNSSILSGYTFARSGNSLVVTANSGGTLSAQYGGLAIDASAVTGASGGANAGLISTGTTVGTKIYALNGATDAGLGVGSTSVSGTVGDSVAQNLNNTKASVTLSFPSLLSAFTTGATGTSSDIVIGTAGSGLSLAFEFTTAASTSNALLIQKGATVSDTIDNALQALNAFANNTTDTTHVTDAAKYVINQLNFRRDGDNIIIESKQSGSVFDQSNAAVSVKTDNLTGASPGTTVQALTGTTTGVNVNNVTNAAFTGTISGFSASFVSSNTVNLAVTVGGIDYAAASVNTSPTSSSTVTFTSAKGGSFTLDLAANQGSTVATQSDADQFAARVNAAFSSLTFSQNRAVTSYQAVGNVINSAGTTVGTLDGTSFNIHLANYDDTKVNSVSVAAAPTGGTDASITLVVNGETFKTSSGIGTKIADNSVIRLTSTTNTNNYIEFHAPTTASAVPGVVTAIDLTSADNASAFQEALKNAFGLNSGGQSLTFQVGNSSTDTLAVSIGTTTTSSLYAGQTASVATQSLATSASAAVDAALNKVTSIRAGVGALEERFNFASAAINSSIQNEDAARGTLLDTDVATESTKYATAQVQLQAGIAVLAQANQLPQNLLKLIG